MSRLLTGGNVVFQVQGKQVEWTGMLHALCAADRVDLHYTCFKQTELANILINPSSSRCKDVAA